MKKEILKWEIASTLFILIISGPLHFVFEWTNSWRPIAWLAPVNESPWEHFKLSFWPGIIFALLEYGMLHKKAPNFWTAKGLGLLSMVFIIGLLFYGYTAVIDSNFLANLLLFGIAVVIGEILTYRVMIQPKMPPQFQMGGMIGLALMASLFAIFSYYPPHLFLFEDPVVNQYGILSSGGH